ncbi:MAG: ATP-dependent DNA helicase RecQ [Acetobacter sp.]|nr:ATP-dependent DNA helicase RecQ [Acetobacter sp.]
MSYNRFVGKTPHEVIQHVFGLQAFYPLQERVVESSIAGQDLLVLMPTGGGKSLCYQIPALCRSGMGVVVSPLIALMDDQVAYLRQRGIYAAALHSDLESTDALQIRADLWRGRIDLLYISPERLLSSGTLEKLKRIPLSLIAIDEAHCVATWGYDFRPEYRGLKALSQYFPHVPRMALTATADEETRKDILQALNMPRASVLASSFYRSNLKISVFDKGVERHKSGWHNTADIRKFLAVIKRYTKAAHIVYCGSRAKTERVVAFLRDQGLGAVLPYHAGLSAQERKAVLLRFRSGEPLVVVATIAFGMGIDRADVRSVIHLDMPSSPEAYYQQIGRAGRDGLLSEAVMLYEKRDISRVYYWIKNAQVSEDQKKIMYRRAEAMIDFVKTKKCRMQVLLHCFGEHSSQPCGHCDRCRSLLRFFTRGL